MYNRNLNLSFLLFGIIIFLQLLPYVERLVQPRPFSNVVSLREEWTDTSIVVEYTFYKEPNCELQDFDVVGVTPGIPKYLEYKDLDPNVEWLRVPGKQGLSIEVLTANAYYEIIEIRTLHICNRPNGTKQKVASLFATLKRPSGLQEVLPLFLRGI